MSGYPYQEPTHVCTTRAQVVAIYGDLECKDELAASKSGSRFENTSRVFDNPILESFETDHLVTVTLPGFGAKKDKGMPATVNRKLQAVYLAAFEKIKAENLPYTLYNISAYYFRYAKNPKIKAVLETRPEYAALKKRSDFESQWNILCAQQDRKLQAFDDQLSYGGKLTAKKNLLSNHSWGNAIDINPGTNPYQTGAKFDMPKRIVEIMAGLGFRWGGFYNDKHDYMHFEYLRASVDGLPDEESPQVFFPFGGGKRRESPLKYYFVNESGPGGYFPLGLQQNLHGGVHLEPGSGKERAPVQAAMPGYIVAARLMAPETGGDNPRVREASDGRHLGFVLVRHELLPREEKSSGSSSGETEGQEPPKPRPLYSLYMHLTPPSWDNPGPDFEKVPWLSDLFKMQFGGVVSLDASSTDLGKTFWAKGPLSPDATSFTVQGRDAPLPAKNGARVLAVAKPSPDDVREAIRAFKDGAIVTFDRPLFPVAAGDLLGYVSAGALAGGGSNGALPKYLHWELFSHGGDEGGIPTLRKQAGDLDKVLKAVKEVRENNFLDMPSGRDPDAPNEVNELLKDAGEKIVEEIIAAGYDRVLRRYFTAGKTFYPGSDNAQKPFTYPVEISLDNKYQYSGEPGGAPCELKVTYKRGGAPLREPEILQVKPDQGKVTLNVPAEADEIGLWSKHFFLDQPSIKPDTLREQRLQARTALFQKVTAGRWRNVVLEHMNEWTPKGLDTQLEARRKAGLLSSWVNDSDDEAFKALKKDLRPLSWWARKKDSDDPYGEVPVLGANAQEKSIFGANDPQLPEDAKVVNMHPVTALWLVDLLIEKKVLGFRSAWPPSSLTRDENTGKPPFLGLLWQDEVFQLGMELIAALVQHGYGSTDGSAGTDVTFWAKPKAGGQEPVALGRAPYVTGVALRRVRFPFWGDWEVYATGGDGKRLEPEATGTTSLSLGKPEAAAETFALGERAVPAERTGKPRPVATGAFVCRANQPTSLAGYIVLEHWKAAKGAEPDLQQPPTPSRLAIPVVAVAPPDERIAGGLKYRGEFIVGLEKPTVNQKVTPNFTFQEFVSHRTFGPVFQGDAKTAFRLAVPLAQRLQALRELCKPRPGHAKDKDLPLVVKQLALDGLSLLVVPASGAKELDAVEAKLAQLPASELFSAERDNDEGGIRLTYEPPPSMGSLALEFDPGPALGRLAADELSAEGESLHVRPRFIAPNGGHLLAGAKLKPIDGVADLFAASAEDIKSACGNDALELVADKRLPPVRRFEFGDIEMKMGNGSVRTEVRLYGDAQPWQLAAPVFTQQGGDKPASKGKIAKGLVLTAEWPLFDKNGKGIPGLWGGSLKVSAECTQPKLVATPPPAVKKELAIKPSLDEFTCAVEQKVLRFQGKATALPTDVDLCVVCERADELGQWKEDAVTTGSIRYTITVRAHFGRCTDAGAFEASLPRSALKNVKGPVRFTWVPRGTRQGSAVDVHGILIQTKSAPEIGPGDLGL